MYLFVVDSGSWIPEISFPGWENRAIGANSRLASSCDAL